MLISVIIPMYNSETTITSCINSVLNQTYVGEVEIIVVNDGSKDNSQAIVEGIIQDNKTKVLIELFNKINEGVSTARNIGIKMAKGDWIALLDSDDVWLPNKLERQIQVLTENPKIDFLGTNRNGEYFDNILWKKLNILTRISPKLLMVKFIFVVPTVIFRKKIISDVGYFDETQKYAEEGNYFIRIAQKYNCFLLNESLVITGDGKAHFGHSGLSGNLKEMEKGELKNLKDALRLKIINSIEYSCLVVFSILKYFRRIIIVKIR
ncbi:glycosyltransferase family 2 protein [Flavobacterium seoulense]|uniref:Benzoate transporter n=1 Tax=Flavobacterium seoulense TaxID=1492738 RepID=A0A066WSL1_9FLAO|nr:glycosyltransferase family 2 protein [Flavobacterium seoulense]KDN53959.1 benzoate transporter [Flavobacterium seoulense]